MSKLIYLSKSDFKIAKSSPKKLYYKKLEYPKNQSHQEDYSSLSNVLIINKIAELLYENPVEIEPKFNSENNLIDAIKQTNEELKKEKVTIFKPLIYHQNKLARLNILVKNNNRFDLIHIDQKPIDLGFNNQKLNDKNQNLDDELKLLNAYRNEISPHILQSKNTLHSNLLRNKRDYKINSIWKNCLVDITYESFVLSELLGSLYDEFELNSYLCLPIKDRVSKNCLGINFSIESSHKVNFWGDLNELRNDHNLHFINVNQEVLELKEKVIKNTNIYLESIVNGIKKIEMPISKNCKNCEFRITNLSETNDSRNGFNECWNQTNNQEAHILDLYQVAKIGEYKNPLINVLIADGKSSLYDIPTDGLNHNSFKERQLIQIKYTKDNQEWWSENLAEILNSLEYPLHFIDFETCRLGIPYHQEIRANEQIAFQWSCHTITEHFIESKNTNFIDITGEFPNFKFAETLMQQLGNNGTILIWGTHEKSVLEDIYEQILYYQYQNQDLLIWLQTLLDNSNRIQSRFIDMNSLTLKHYFHPLMKGKTSLKVVMPAIWTTNNYLHQIPQLSQYFKLNQNNEILSPYQTLSEIQIDQKYQVINDGSGAMMAYQEIIYSPLKHDQNIRKKWEVLLKQYCGLDTLAMIIVWIHWQHLIGK